MRENNKKIPLTSEYANGRYVNIREAEVGDAKFILSLRCDEIKSRFINKTESNLNKQIEYLERYKMLDDEYYFIIMDKNGTPIGTIRMYDLGKNDFVSGSWLMIKEATAEQVLEGNFLMLHFAYSALNYRKFHFDVRIKNKKVATFHQTMGAVMVSKNELDYFFEADLATYIANLAKLLNADSATMVGEGIIALKIDFDKWLNNYLAFKKQIFGISINLRDVESTDAEFILSLRCDTQKAKFLHKTENNLTKQIAYIESYKAKENEWYFIIESKSGERLGTVRIYDIVDNDDFCWGSWIIKAGASANVAIESVLLVYEYAFYILGFTKAHFDVRKDNIKVKTFHKRFGAREVGKSDEDIFFNFFREDYEKIKEKYIFNFLSIY